MGRRGWDRGRRVKGQRTSASSTDDSPAPRGAARGGPMVIWELLEEILHHQMGQLAMPLSIQLPQGVPCTGRVCYQLPSSWPPTPSGSARTGDWGLPTVAGPAVSPSRHKP